MRAQTVERLIAEMVGQQEAKLLAFGRRLLPELTGEDVLQPHDFVALRASPEFNYEDGVLAGMRAVAAAVRAAARRRNRSPAG